MEIVTRFTNDKKRCADNANGRLKQKAFTSAKDKGEISVVCIDSELTQNNADEIIFKIGDLVYINSPKKAEARGDMKVSDINNITYSGEENRELKMYLESSPSNVPNHYNIKPLLQDLRFAVNCAHNLSRISKLVIRN